LISILSFFVGLIFGVHEVELSVAGPVARVELRLDGAVVAAADRPPWRLSVDFGDRIRPAVLEAVALDRAGSPLDRDVRWVNLPESRADAAIVPTYDDHGFVTSARLTWQSPEFDRPKEIRVQVDGEPVAAGQPWRVDLTGYSLDEVHILDAEFVFSSELSLRRQLPFGEGFAGSTTSGLTAVPVSLEELEELPPVDALGGWFEAADESLRVTAWERPDARLVVVRDPGVEQSVRWLWEERRRQLKKERRKGAARDLDLLDEDTEIRVLVPEPIVPEGRGSPTLLFPYSKTGSPGGEGLLKAALAPRNERMLGVGLMLPDAVAMAGLHAAEGNGRRVVLLMLGAEREDVQRFTPDTVRSFLRDLGVPLVVWDLSSPVGSAPGSWRPERVIEDFDDLARGCRHLRRMLEDQRIVWVGGRHLPQAVGLGTTARGIVLVE
jgi:hypothetical protein